MLFNSTEFLLFLPAVLVLYFSLSHRRQNIMLLVASYFFYGWWDWRFCLLLLTSTVVDYGCGMGIAGSEDPRRRRRLLILSVCTNLGILGFFKYFNFFVGSAEALARSLGYDGSLTTLSIILPVGISFYTFQTMTYTIDIYRRQFQPTRDFVNFALFVSYFPQLVAGPIERAQHLLPSIERERHVTAYHVHSGLWLILIGFFKKMAIADAVGPFVDEAFAGWETAGWRTLLGAISLFSLQIYGDFSGYSDIARGVSRLMGIELMVNFRRPYFATSFREFWHRWHISLSTFLRDYLYIPLGGSRHGERRTYFNLSMTMLLGGLWHGASWIFVVWGALHGLYLSVGRALFMWGSRHPREESPTRSVLAPIIGLAKVFVVFALATLTWIYFRSQTFEQANHVMWTILSAPFTDLHGVLQMALLHSPPEDLATNIKRFLFFAALLLPLDLVQEWVKSEEPWPLRMSPPIQGLLAALLLVGIFVFGSKSGAFIYFQF